MMLSKLEQALFDELAKMEIIDAHEHLGRERNRVAADYAASTASPSPWSGDGRPSPRPAIARPARCV